jgi:hypothetical protein
MKKHPPHRPSRSRGQRRTGDGRFPIGIDRRELATILAALRFHRDENLQGESQIPDLVIRDIASDGGTLVPLDFTQIGQLCQRMGAGDGAKDAIIVAGNEGLLIGRPPRESGDRPLFRIVYVIDVAGKDQRQVAKSAFGIMTDPRSLPPVLHVLDDAGSIHVIDLAQRRPPIRFT